MNKNDNPTASANKTFRGRKWIRPDLQFRVILASILLCTLTLLINYPVCLIAMHSFADANTLVENIVLDRVLSIYWKVALVSLLIMIPVSFGVGTLYSFRFAGPIYRIHRFLQELISQRWDVPCRLRQGDMLHDLKDAVNGAVSSFSERLRDQDRVLKQYDELVRSQLESLPNKETFQKVLAESTQAQELLKQRLSGDAQPSPPEGNPPSPSGDDSLETEPRREEKAAAAVEVGG